MDQSLSLSSSWQRPLWALAISTLALACGGRVTPDDQSDGGPMVDAGDPTAPLFDPTHIVEVRIDLPPADWDTLREQSRDLFDLLGGNCLGAPFPSPFTYFTGTVTIDGKRFDSVGVRKKGFLGSLSTEKPSLKLKLDRKSVV